MCRPFHTHILACSKGYYDQLSQMLRTGQVVLIKIHVFCQELKGYHLQLLEIMSLYYYEAGMWIERCRGDCHDSCRLHAVGEQHS